MKINLTNHKYSFHILKKVNIVKKKLSLESRKIIWKECIITWYKNVLFLVDYLLNCFFNLFANHKALTIDLLIRKETLS